MKRPNPLDPKDLMALSKLDPAQRCLCASAIAQGARASVCDGHMAVGDLAQKARPDTPRDAWMGRMVQLWRAGQKSWRAAFLTRGGGGRAEVDVRRWTCGGTGGGGFQPIKTGAPAGAVHPAQSQK